MILLIQHGWDKVNTFGTYGRIAKLTFLIVLHPSLDETITREVLD